MPTQAQNIITDEELHDLLQSRSNTDPVPILIHRAENRVLRELRDIAVQGCNEHVKRLAECAEGKLLSVVWHCRKYSKAVDACMREFGADEALKDELRRRHGKKFPKAVKGYKLPNSVTADQS
ncbi:hypothetical protein BWQ96_07925 [Gracilariopsis chorda]|uniref:COX assembly mitochondrial protein n=1 Tax=Gracilariopsis chorda TaxID=448386 RepID=A0A2V3IJY3_9FLOR|nr:hypothetical protein BWQ96_07925 [Gracilariopsis chorda]|eukprot:PXF42405.1 hypothetical protein BWQ96_07925 [Gracilariopsis chorda]